MSEPIASALEKLKKSVKRAAEKADDLCESSEQLVIAVKDLSIASDEWCMVVIKSKISQYKAFT